MITESESFQISTTGGHILSKTTVKIGERSQKTQGPPLQEKGGGGDEELNTNNNGLIDYRSVLQVFISSPKPL